MGLVFYVIVSCSYANFITGLLFEPESKREFSFTPVFADRNHGQTFGFGLVLKTNLLNGTVLDLNGSAGLSKQNLTIRTELVVPMFGFWNPVRYSRCINVDQKDQEEIDFFKNQNPLFYVSH